MRNLLVIVLLIASLVTSCSKRSKIEQIAKVSKETIADTSNLTINQKQVRNQYNLGNTYYYTANYTMAIASFTKAIGLDSSFADAYYHRGNVYYNTGEIDKAIIDYNKTLELSPRKIDAMVDIYVAYKAKNDKVKTDFWRNEALKYKDQLNQEQLRELGISVPANRLPG